MGPLSHFKLGPRCKWVTFVWCGGRPWRYLAWEVLLATAFLEIACSWNNVEVPSPDDTVECEDLMTFVGC